MVKMFCVVIENQAINSVTNLHHISATITKTTVGAAQNRSFPILRLLEMRNQEGLTSRVSTRALCTMLKMFSGLQEMRKQAGSTSRVSTWTLCTMVKMFFLSDSVRYFIDI